VLGSELPLCPLVADVELNTEIVADFPIDAIPDGPFQDALAIGNLDGGVHRDGVVELETCAGVRDIF
jgi:hypothetical protein